MYRVLFHSRAERAYKHLDAKTLRRLNRAIAQLQANPIHGKDIKELRGELQGLYRLRVGEFRIIYRVDERKRVVLIEALGPRGRMYR